MSSDIKSINLKIITLGSTYTGKSAIILKYLKESIIFNSFGTVGLDYLQKEITLDDKTIKMTIFDTAGQEKYKSLSNIYIRKIDSIILVFDLTNRETFQNLEEWNKQIDECIDRTKITVVLLGNKCDCDDNIVINEEEEKNNKRDVSSSEGIEYAEKYNMRYFETSAKNGKNINECFDYLISSFLDKWNNDDFRKEYFERLKNEQRRGRHKGNC